MAELFGVDVRTVSYHLQEIYASGELTPEATLRKIWRVQREGKREVRREIELYNLDAITQRYTYPPIRRGYSPIRRGYPPIHRGSFRMHRG